MANLGLQIIPRVSDDRLYPVVDKVIEYIRSTGVKHIVGPLETVMEGELSELLKIVGECFAICEKEGASRCLATVKIDHSTKGVSMDEKIAKYR